MKLEQRVDTLEAVIEDLSGRLIATEFALKVLIAQRLDWTAVVRSWDAEKAKLVEQMTEGALSQRQQIGLLDHLGKLSRSFPNTRDIG